MELELQKDHFDCYQLGATISDSHEETAETIVPDYSPDIARIVDANAILLLRSQSLQDGKLTVSGTVKLTLLYMAEDTQGLRTMDYAVPFEHSFDAKLPESAEVCVEGRVCGADTRLLNPRKVFTRLDIDWKVTPYRKATLTVCGGIVNQEGYSIETLCEKREVSLIRSAGGKEFVFSDELTLPGGREAIRELLCSRVKLRVTEAKNVGSKLIIKGLACVSLLYTAEDGKLCSYAEELPFSQILEGIEEGSGEVSASVTLSMSGCEIHTGGEGAANDGRTVSVKLLLNAFAVLRQTENVCCITDLYSTAYTLDAQLNSVELWQKPEIMAVSQSVREQIDTGTDVQCVLSADVCFGSTSVTQSGGGQASIRAAATVSMLYLDESGVPLTAERRIEITAEASVNGMAQVSVENVCAGDITANINAEGVELRFPAEFMLVSCAALSCDCLMSLSTDGLIEKNAEDPSLVLRALGEEEKLWDIAKQYRTTVEDILAANELTDSSLIDVGQMLLIPRKR